MKPARLFPFVGLLLTLLPQLPLAAQDSPAVDLNQLNETAAGHVRRQRYDQAMEIYRQIVQVDPYWTDIWYNLGEVSRVSQRYGDCVLYFSRYLFLIPDAADAQDVRNKMDNCGRHIPNSAQIEVTAQPEGSRISINGIELGRHHLDPLSLAPGSYELQITAQGHQPFREVIAVGPEDSLHLDLVLEPLTLYGMLRVEANVQGAMVTVEGEVAGTTPLAEPMRLQTGLYLVRLTKEGYHDWVRRVEIEPDQEYLLEVEMREQ